MDPAESSQTAGIKEPQRQYEWRLKALIAALAIVAGIALLAVSQARVSKAINWETPLSQVGLALVITGITFILIEQQMEKGNREYTKGIVDQTEKNIRGLLKDVKRDLEALTKHNQILRGAVARDVEQIYAMRAEGLRDLMEDLRRSKRIRMIGISLREYFVPAGHYYRDMEGVLDDIARSTDRTIQVLLINPYCEQATIRAERESDKGFSEQNRYELSGLYADVWQSIRYLRNRESADAVESAGEVDPSGSAHGRSGTIKARVYNSAPTCFLVITDRYTYIEQYHYGVPKSGLVGGNFPMLKFPTITGDPANESDGTEMTSVARHLSGHFDYIWNQFGTRRLDYLMEGKNIGVSKSAWECKLANLFSSRTYAQERIKYLLSRERVVIKLIGISLRDFFHAGKDLYTTIQEVSKTVSVKALMLDPLSEQGRFRAEREEPGVSPEGGNLYYEVNTSIRSVERLKKEGSLVDAKLYGASTNCFVILTSESVIVEQYHYGSAGHGATILGGKVAVFEYSKGSAMYAEIEGHFDYVWEKLSVDMEVWKKSHGEMSD